MQYTTADNSVVHIGTGNRMHQDTAPVPTAVEAADLNMVIWSLMEVVETAGLSGIAFDPSNAATYSRLLGAMQALFGEVLSTSGVPYGLKIGVLRVYFGKSPIASGGNVSSQPVTFTAAFPTAGLIALATGDNGANGSWYPIAAMARDLTATGMTIICDTTDSGQSFSAGRSAYWLAIGY